MEGGGQKKFAKRVNFCSLKEISNFPLTLRKNLNFSENNNKFFLIELRFQKGRSEYYEFF